MPNTPNMGLEVPTTGSLAGTWGSAAINPDFLALDGLFGGVATIALTSANVSLSAPSGKSIAPAAGPVESQNAVIKLTGTLTANVTVTLPLPGFYIIDNQTVGAFYVTLRAVTATSVIALPPGFLGHIYNDGENVKFVNLGKTGDMEFWAGLSSMPSWVAACTVKPYLLCDGTLYNFSDYPYLGPRLLDAFGGNGTTTFGVPDQRGRIPLAYDGTGTRITTAGCGLNGQTLGASLDAQSITLDTTMIPAHTHIASVTDPGHTHASKSTLSSFANGGNTGYLFNTAYGAGFSTNSATTGISVSNANTGDGGAHGNVQPSLVAGILVVKT